MTRPNALRRSHRRRLAATALIARGDTGSILPLPSLRIGRPGGGRRSETTATVMHRSLKALALGPLVVAALAAPHASAAAAEPFTLTSTADFANEVFTFTATGPLCSSGTFEDDVVQASGYQSDLHVLLVIESVYTCNDGSGSFFVRKNLDFWFGLDGGPGNGPMKITGGTGDYAGIAGNGYEIGGRPVDIDHGAGTATGVIVHP
jgi:hypothetical protein